MIPPAGLRHQDATDAVFRSALPTPSPCWHGPRLKPTLPPPSLPMPSICPDIPRFSAARRMICSRTAISARASSPAVSASCQDVRLRMRSKQAPIAHENWSPLIAIGEELGALLAKKAVAALGIDAAKAQSYGKAAGVGENGELEHAAAILHPKMGAPVRKVLGKGAALIPSSKKRSGPGTTLHIPLGHKDAAFVRSRLDGIAGQFNDAPRANVDMDESQVNAR